MLKKDLIELKTRLTTKNSSFEKVAFFKDKNSNTNIVLIRIVPKEAIILKSYNDKQEETGYLNIYFHPNKRLFLDTIYCYDKYRGLGIATKLSELVDYLLQDYENYIIRGVYQPSQLSHDRENNISCSKEELIKRANNFYYKNGYFKLSYNEYIKDKGKYPFINEDYDFQLGEELASYIIVKKIEKQKSYPFKEQDGVIVDESIEKSYENNFGFQRR
mgnify:CR=1 FL=1